MKRGPDRDRTRFVEGPMRRDEELSTLREHRGRMAGAGVRVVGGAVRRDEALRILREHRARLEGMGIRSVALFGSVARDEAGPESDGDVLGGVDEPTFPGATGGRVSRGG